jgi:RNA polymerase sigma-70 factor (ECF subfamily)
MVKSLLRTNKETEENIAEIYERHVKTVYRVCFAFMKNSADAEDAVSDTFLRMMQSGAKFDSAEHEKAWLIRTASNVCKNLLKHWWRKNKPLEEAENVISAHDNIEIDSVFGAVMQLPERLKTAVYLYYYEGHTSAEISKLLKKPQSTIRNHLREARKLLKTKLGDDYYED